MYNGRIQLVAIAGSIMLLVFIFILIRRRRLKEEYSILWLLFGIVFLALSTWRGSIDWLAAKMGIAYSPAALFLIFLMAIFVIMIDYSTIISKISESNKNLAQELGLLKEELKRLKDQSDQHQQEKKK